MQSNPILPKVILMGLLLVLITDFFSFIDKTTNS